MEPKDGQAKLQKTPVKFNTKKRWLKVPIKLSHIMVLVMVLVTSWCWLPKIVLPHFLGPWRTVPPLRCSSKWKRPTRCPCPLRMGSWPTRRLRGNSTATASKLTSRSQSSLNPSSRSPKARHLTRVAVRVRAAAYPLLSLMKTQSECGTVILQRIFCNGPHCLAMCLRCMSWPFNALCFSPEPGRKQKTPKKFTGEQPSISGTFGLKGKW